MILGITGAPRAGKRVPRLFWVRAAVGPAPTERPDLGPAVAAALAKSAGFGPR
jgi:hypothetical protein